MLGDTYPETVLHVDNHTSDVFSTAETRARASFYGVSGVPHVQVDGSRSSVGGGGCNPCFTRYRSLYTARMTETNSLSPVEIDETLLSVGTTTVDMTATFTLVDPVALGTVSAYFFLYEDDITWCCGYGGVNHWDHITRAIQTQAVTTLVNVGNQVTITKTVPLNGGWNPENLHAIAVLQTTTGTKAVVQSGIIHRLVDFSLDMPIRVESVRFGNDQALYTGTLHNDLGNQDTYTLSVDQAAGWPTDFSVEGDPAWYTTREIVLAGGTSKLITVRVQTDAQRRIGTTGFSISAASTGRLLPVSLRTFNNSPAVLLVDDDGGVVDWNGNPYDLPQRAGMDAQGYLYEHWDAAGGHGGSTPSISSLRGFDAVIWQTGPAVANVLTADDIITITDYIDEGGPIYVESMDFLNTQGVITSFLAYYMGVALFTRDSRAVVENGVAGEPMTDGMVLPVTFQFESQNKIDTIVPRPTASPILLSETGNINAIRNLGPQNQHVVFSTVPGASLPQSAPAPNNYGVLLDHILRWLIPADPADVSGNLPMHGTGILTAQPNPFGQATSLSFQLSPKAAAAPVELLVVDPSGRQVRSLIQGPVQSGAHSVSWDGLDQSGHPVPSGVYFARLQSVEGTLSTKVTLTR